MDIEKLKAEFEQSECFKRLEHVAQYTFFEFGAYIKRTDVPADIEKKCGKLITALLFSWSAWKEAKSDDTQSNEALERLESTANFMRGMCFDPRLHPEIKLAISGRVSDIDEFTEAAQEPTND